MCTGPWADLRGGCMRMVVYKVRYEVVCQLVYEVVCEVVCGRGGCGVTYEVALLGGWTVCEVILRWCMMWYMKVGV